MGLTELIFSETVDDRLSPHLLINMVIELRDHHLQNARFSSISDLASNILFAFVQFP